uniref:Uncharacterized protein n=1 Tax=Strix occidentalis caurina TaxID=311401 RepID=A0A8D0KZV1_STROC
MALRRLIQQNHNANLVGLGASPAGGDPALPMDSRRIQHLANTVGTLPRGRKQVWGHSCAPGADGSFLPGEPLAARVCRDEQKGSSFPE